MNLLLFYLTAWAFLSFSFLTHLSCFLNDNMLPGFLDIEMIAGSSKHNFAYCATMTEAENASEVILSKDTPYLILTGEPWGVFCEALGVN